MTTGLDIVEKVFGWPLDAQNLLGISFGLWEVFFFLHVKHFSHITNLDNSQFISSHFPFGFITMHSSLFRQLSGCPLNQFWKPLETGVDSELSHTKDSLENVAPNQIGLFPMSFFLLRYNSKWSFLSRTTGSLPPRDLKRNWNDYEKYSLKNMKINISEVECISELILEFSWL